MSFQVCPLCQGSGSSGIYSIVCDICKGYKIIDEATGKPPAEKGLE